MMTPEGPYVRNKKQDLFEISMLLLRHFHKSENYVKVYVELPKLIVVAYMTDVVSYSEIKW